MTNKYGLIGFPLSHSFSKKYFTEKFIVEGIKDTEYENYPIECIEDVKQIIRVPGMRGFNITIPYKEQVIPYLDELDAMAAEVGAVNTVRIVKDGETLRTKGYNTDVYGFSESIKPFLQPHHRNALILGTGGASKAVAYALNQLGISYKFVSRSKQVANTINYNDLTPAFLQTQQIIINTTPTGTYPNIDEAPPFPYANLDSGHLLYDLVYNPAETLFLKNGKTMGAIIANGYDMLRLQAEKAWAIWNE